MAIRIAGAGRRHGHGRIDGVEEGIRGRRSAAVVGDLQQVHVSKACQQLGIDLFLDVPREQEPTTGHGAEQDDRHVVDPGAGVRWLARHGTGHRPQHLERDVVDRQPVPGGEEAARRWASGEFRGPGRVSGTGPEHPGLERPTDAISLEQHGQPSDVIFVRVRQDDGIEPAIPRRDPPIELDEQPVGIRPAVDEQAPAARALDEDRVALPDVQDRHRRAARGPFDDDRSRQHDRRRQGDEREPGRACPPSWTGMCRGLPAGHRRRIAVRRRARGRRGRRRRHSNAATAPTLPSAATTFDGGSSVALAYGTSAANRAIATMIVERHPAGEREDRRQRIRRADLRQDARTERHAAGGHGDRHDRDDAQVGRGRDQGEPAERREDDRERGRLRSKGYAEALRQPVGHAPAAEPPDSVTDRRRPGDEARRREG